MPHLPNRAGPGGVRNFQAAPRTPMPQDVTNDLSGVTMVAAAVASASGYGADSYGVAVYGGVYAPAVTVNVAPPASSATASATTPNAGDGIVTAVATAAASSANPAALVTVAAAAAAGSAAPATPNVGEGIVASAATTAASAATPAATITVSAAAASASASPVVPNAGDGIIPGAATTTASADQPAVTVSAAADTADASASVPVPAVSGAAPIVVVTTGGHHAGFRLVPAPTPRRNVAVRVDAASAHATMSRPTVRVDEQDEILAALGVEATRLYTADDEAAAVHFFLSPV